MSDNDIRDTLAQTMWEAYVHLGFDPDGDDNPGAWIAGAGSHEKWAEQWLEEIADHRADDDQAMDESIALDRAIANVRRIAEQWDREADERGPDDTIRTQGAADMILHALKGLSS